MSCLLLLHGLDLQGSMLQHKRDNNVLFGAAKNGIQFTLAGLVHDATSSRFIFENVKAVDHGRLLHLSWIFLPLFIGGGIDEQYHGGGLLVGRGIDELSLCIFGLVVVVVSMRMLAFGSGSLFGSLFKLMRQVAVRHGQQERQQGGGKQNKKLVSVNIFFLVPICSFCEIKGTTQKDTSSSDQWYLLYATLDGKLRKPNSLPSYD